MNKLFYIGLPENKNEIAEFVFWVLVAYALFTWFSIQIDANITADTLWLCDAASRLLAGERMAQSYYDPNPPLSVLLYVPPVLASMTGLITVYHAVFGYVLLLLAGSAAVTYRILKVIPGVETTTAMAVTAALIVANTIMPSTSLTERDQLIGIWLLPFLLTQLAITKNWPVPPALKHITLLTGAILILVKPHHGLMPTLILLHRAITQKRLSVWKDADFVYLAGAVLVYSTVLALYFSDFVTIILPDVLHLYASENIKFVLFKALYYGLLCVTVLLLAVVVGKTSWLSYFMLSAALISLIPFIVQMHGYHYHILPALTFFWCGTAIVGKEFCQRYMAPHLSLIFVTAAMTIFAFLMTPTRLYTPTHDQYKELPLAKTLSDCADPCPVFVINDHIEITHQTALYSHKPWASRFPSLWFIPGTYRLEEKAPAEFARLRTKYATMIAEDLERYKPQRVLVGSFKLKGDRRFDFIDFFDDEAVFRKAWGQYEQKEDFEMNQGVYFPRSKQFKNHEMTYKVFERRPN